MSRGYWIDYNIFFYLIKFKENPIAMKTKGVKMPNTKSKCLCKSNRKIQISTKQTSITKNIDVDLINTSQTADKVTKSKRKRSIWKKFLNVSSWISVFGFCLRSET